MVWRDAGTRIACALDEVSVGQKITLAFRRRYMDRERGFTGYFWKAVPVPGSAPEKAGEENIRFDGNLVGNLVTQGKVFVGQSGKINGEIHCKNCEVEGVVDGKVVVEELLSLRSMSKLFGEIKTGKLAIEPGATFTGKCDMGGKREAASEAAAPKTAAK